GRQSQHEIGNRASQPAKSEHPAVLRCGRVRGIMGNRTVIMIEPRTNAMQSKMGTSALIFTLVTLFFTSIILTAEAKAQMRRPGRFQKKIEKLAQPQGAKKLDSSASSSNNPASNSVADAALDERQEPEVPKKGIQAGGGSLGGNKQKSPPRLFRPGEEGCIIPRVCNPPTLLIIFRQLDLTDQQKQGIRAIRNRVGNRLGFLQRDHRELELQLNDAIYGEDFDPKRVEELAAQVAEKQSEMVKLRASIEAQFRQVLTPDQFYVFQWLIAQMVLPPQRRIPPAQLRQLQQQRRMGPPNRPNQQDYPQ